MNNYSIPYHDVDILIPAQQFEINFNYTSGKVPNFIDSMIMRLLRIAPLSVKNIAYFLGMNQREVRIVIDHLITTREIELQQDGLFSLTNKSMKYFVGVDSLPKITSVLEHKQRLMYELTNFNYINQRPDNNMYGLKLTATSSNLASSEAIVRDRFQKQFYQLVEEEIITLNKMEGNAKIYKMGNVRKLKDCTVRKELDLNIDSQAEPQSIKVLDTIISEDLKDKTYQALAQSKKGDNIRDIVKHLDGFEVLNLNQYFKDGNFLATQALFDTLSSFGGSDSKENHLFIGPCYSRANSKIILEKIKASLSKNDKATSLYWLAPDDAFWGKSLRFNSFFSDLINLKIQDSAPLKFRCFLPIVGKDDYLSINNYKKIIGAKGHHQYFYGIEQGILDGHFEIMALKSEFVVVIVHVQHSESDYLTSFPVGVISYDTRLVDNLITLFEAWQLPEDDGGLTFGPIFIK